MWPPYIALQKQTICIGARLVISHPQGREVLEQQRQQYPNVIISDLPEKLTLEKVADQHSFDLVEFVDEPGFYLAVLKLGKAVDWLCMFHLKTNIGFQCILGIFPL